MKSKKSAQDSRVISARVMMPEDANPAGIVLKNKEALAPGALRLSEKENESES